MDKKESVRQFWDGGSCGEALYLERRDAAGYAAQSAERYRLEPYIADFAGFRSSAGKRVLEIGVGLGADHAEFAKAGAEISGIDLTPRAVQNTRQRFALLGLAADVEVGDAEALAYPTNTFDLVYSWGVIHHSPDTARAAQQILRVLKPGGEFRIMIYYYWSIVGLMLWLRYGLGKGKPFAKLSEMYATHLESPGTKAYKMKEAHALFHNAQSIRCEIVLTHGDLLESEAGQRHQGFLLDMARKVWPRWLLRRFAQRFGLFLLIKGEKPLSSVD